MAMSPELIDELIALAHDGVLLSDTGASDAADDELHALALGEGDLGLHEARARAALSASRSPRRDRL